MNITPMAGAAQQRLSPYDAENPESTGGGARGAQRGQAPDPGGRGGRGGGGGGRGGFPGGEVESRARVVMQFPSNPDDMLLSGVLVGGQSLSGRAQVVDAPVGQGHVVMFAIRPFWRWQTQGTYFLGFNTILNWNDLDAGRAGARRSGTSQAVAGIPTSQSQLPTPSPRPIDETRSKWICVNVATDIEELIVGHHLNGAISPLINVAGALGSVPLLIRADMCVHQALHVRRNIVVSR